MLDCEETEQQRVDDKGMGKRGGAAIIDALGNAEVRDEADRIEEGEEEHAIGGSSVGREAKQSGP